MDFREMIEAVRAFHRARGFDYENGEDLLYRMNLLMEEVGEICECITKGRPIEALAEEHADLLILLIGNAVAAGFDLEAAFVKKLAELERRPSVRLNDRIRVMKADENERTE